MSSDYVAAAISPTDSGFKIAFTDPDDSLLDWMEFDNEEIYQMIRYLTDQKRGCNGLCVIGYPYDRWPLGLVKILEEYGHKPRWVEPELTRQVMQHMILWTTRRKYHRARTLGYLYRLNDNHSVLPFPETIAFQWQPLLTKSDKECLP
ncbi:MAG: hypothetical protein AB2L14_28950 [Candidatus Xenobiia bacterium LiM19]